MLDYFIHRIFMSDHLNLYLQYLLQVIELLKPKIQTLMEKCNTVCRPFIKSHLTHCVLYLLLFRHFCSVPVIYHVVIIVVCC